MDPSTVFTQQKIFDVSKLTDEEIGQLEYILLSPAYERVFKPYLYRMQKSIEHMMLDRSQRRKEEFPDDFLAGEAVGIAGLLAFFDSLAEQINMARVAAVQQATPDEQYTLLRAQGLIKHSGQAVNAAELAAAEDY